MEPVDLTTFDKNGFDCVDKQEDLWDLETLLN